MSAADYTFIVIAECEPLPAYQANTVMAKRALHSFKRIKGVTTVQDGENIRQIGLAYPAEHGEEGHRCSGFCPHYEDQPKRSDVK